MFVVNLKNTMRTLLFIPLFLFFFQVFSQNKVIRKLNDPEYKMVGELVKEYSKFLDINLNETAYEEQRNFNMAFTPSRLHKSTISIWNDKDSATPGFVPVFDFMKSYKNKLGMNYSARFILSPIKKPDVEYDQLRKYHFIILPAKKVEKWNEIQQRTDTVVVPIYSRTDTTALNRDTLSSTVKIDSVLTGYDTTFVVVADTIEKTNTSDNIFFIRTTETQGKYSSFKIYSLSVPGKNPALEALEPEMEWWVNLPENWKKYFKEQFKLNDYPEYYQIRKCQGLRTLDISKQDISDISFLSNFKLLEALNISGTQIKDLSPIKDLTNLRELDISATKVDTLLHLQNLTKLEKLDVSGLKIYSLANISGLVNLIELQCHENNLRDIEPLKNMLLLEELDISLNYDLKNVDPITELPVLEKLVLKKVKIESLEPLTKLQSLIFLDVYNAGITDVSPLKRLPKLMHLDLSHNKITDISVLRSLNYITHLELASTGVSDLGPISGFRHLEVLNISGIPTLKSLSPVPNGTLLKLACHYTGIPSGDVQRFKKKNPNCKITYY